MICVNLPVLFSYLVGGRSMILCRRRWHRVTQAFLPVLQFNLESAVEFNFDRKAAEVAKGRKAVPL